LDGVGTASGRAEELAAHLLAERSPKRRVLVIVNPYATTVSDRLRSWCSRPTVPVREGARHRGAGRATEICRDAARERYDVVVVFGSDGTVKEA
jgi:diacylglycerol kinase family enzyme